MAALNIANLYESAQEVEGVVRVLHPAKKIANNQSEYLAMDLSNITGSISAFAWDNKYHSSYIPKENDIICIHGRTKILPISKEVAIDIYEILPVEKEVDNPISFMPLPAGVNKTNLQELIETIDELSSPSLKAFLYNVFSDETITKQFITGKASAEHHHSEYGGLLRHSLEVVRFVKRCTEIPHHELEVGVQHTAAFAQFCANKYGLDRIGGLKPHMVESYVKNMQERGVNGRSIANHLSAVRTLAHAVGKANIVARENNAYAQRRLAEGATRMQVALELGHGRIEITGNYSHK